MIAFYIIGAIMSFFLNISVVIVLLTSKQKMTYINFIMVSLSISNILQTSVGYVLEIYARLKYIAIDQNSCVIAGFTITFLALVSISHFTVMSIVNAAVLKYPMKLHKWKYKPISALYYVILPSWLYGLFWALLPLFGWSSYEREPGAKHRCSITMMRQNATERSYAFTLLTFCYIFPLFITTLSSIFIVQRMQKISKIKGLMEEAKAKRQSETNKITVMRIVLIVTFLISWTPYASCVFVMTTEPSVVKESWLEISAMFAKSSTLYNPMIYLVFLKGFRRQCRRFLRRFFCIDIRMTDTFQCTCAYSQRQHFLNFRETSF